MTIIIIALVWLLCGVISYGRTYAHFQGEYPGIAEKYRNRDRRVALRVATTGPIGLIYSLLQDKHGWRL